LADQGVSQAPKPSRKPRETEREASLPLPVAAVRLDQTITWNPARNREPRIIKTNTENAFHAHTHTIL